MSNVTKRDEFLPFARPSIDEDAIDMIAEAIRAGWVASGPKVIEFEKSFGARVGSSFSLAMNSATAGLHTAVSALGLKGGDEVITTPMTYASTINAILFAGARPVLADIDRRTLDIVPENIERAITPRTKAIIPVHFAGMPCDMDAIEAIAEKHDLAIIEDAAHAIGASYKGRPVGADRGERRAVVFSFHPTKNITTSEGGMLCTGDESIAEFTQVFRQNGMSKGAWNRYAATGTPHYDVPFPGLKYTMTDIQASIGISQLKRLDGFNERRRALCAIYEEMLRDVPGIILTEPARYEHVHSRHIFTPLIDIDRLTITRDGFMSLMRERNIGTALHYRSIHLFQYYANELSVKHGDLPEAEFVSDRIVSFPLFPAMSDDDARIAAKAASEICAAHLR